MRFSNADVHVDFEDDACGGHRDYWDKGLTGPCDGVNRCRVGLKALKFADDMISSSVSTGRGGMSCKHSREGLSASLYSWCSGAILASFFFVLACTPARRTHHSHGKTDLLVVPMHKQLSFNNPRSAVSRKPSRNLLLFVSVPSNSFDIRRRTLTYVPI